MKPDKFTSNGIQIDLSSNGPLKLYRSCLIAIIGLFVCVFVIGVWYFSAREGINTLFSSIMLQVNGATTMGTVSSEEEFDNGDPIAPDTSYKLTATFEVDGKTYFVKGSKYYPSRVDSWVGESMPIIYDPEYPDTAFINNFEERWLDPIIKSAP